MKIVVLNIGSSTDSNNDNFGKSVITAFDVNATTKNKSNGRYLLYKK